MAGFVAGEGCFTRSRTGRTWADGDAAIKFRFCVTVASRDRPVLEALRDALERGSIYDSPPGKEHWQPRSTFVISSLRGHIQATIPFMDQYLLACRKRASHPGTPFVQEALLP